MRRIGVRAGNILLTGHTEGAIDFGNGPIPHVGRGTFITRLGPSGAALFGRHCHRDLGAGQGHRGGRAHVRPVSSCEVLRVAPVEHTRQRCADRRRPGEARVAVDDDALTEGSAQSRDVSEILGSTDRELVLDQVWLR